MALSPRLDLRQSQQLVMTPQLQQAIKLLQMSNLELSAFVAAELEKNPLLEKDRGEQSSETDLQTDAGDVKEDRSVQDTAELTSSDQAIGHEDAPLDTSYENVFTGQSQSEAQQDAPSLGSYGDKSGRFDGGDYDPFEHVADVGQTLREFLTEQINLEPMNAQERLLLLALIDDLDGNGYLTVSKDDFCFRFGCCEEEFDDVLEILQSLEPSGVGARNLSECLQIQLLDQGLYDSAYEAILANLHLLGARKFQELMRLSGLDQEELLERIAEIRSLDPKPALKFDPDVITQHIVPDLLMRAGPNQSWIVELNPDSLPSVLVSQTYYNQIQQGAKSSEDKAYIAEQLNNANWLVKALHQRATTIMKVASEIVRRQDMFFRQGIKYLRPMTLKDVAETIEIHESTVSRVTSNKYIATQRGLFELKYFFSTALASSEGGEAHAAESIKFQIKELIDQEDPKKILSDDKIVELLKQAGIAIARRTVAKYRESLNIPSSVQRRREKKNSGFG